LAPRRGDVCVSAFFVGPLVTLDGDQSRPSLIEACREALVLS
jgi:hypothetical protein